MVGMMLAGNVLECLLECVWVWIMSGEWRWWVGENVGKCGDCWVDFWGSDGHIVCGAEKYVGRMG